MLQLEKFTSMSPISNTASKCLVCYWNNHIVYCIRMKYSGNICIPLSFFFSPHVLYFWVSHYPCFLVWKTDSRLPFVNNSLENCWAATVLPPIRSWFNLNKAITFMLHNSISLRVAMWPMFPFSLPTYVFLTRPAVVGLQQIMKIIGETVNVLYQKKWSENRNWNGRILTIQPSVDLGPI